VAIARALVNRPALLFADEPTGNLDSRTSEEVLHMFQQLNAQESITLILVTHDANVARYAGRVITIHDGVIMDRSFGARLKEGASQKDVLPVAAAMGGAE
jgi:ABC-type lipoprotein export system ATPase subunit